MEIENPYESEENDFKAVTDLTQLLRFKALSILLENGLPEETEDRNYFLKLTMACDATALNVKKVQDDSALTAVKTNTYNLVNLALSNVSDNPFVEDEEVEVPDFERVEGESTIGLDDCLND